MVDSPQVYAPHIYGFVGGAVNTYLVDGGEDGLIVIDAGLPGTTRRMLQLIQQLGRTPQDVRHILITHADVDHVGSLKPLVEATGATVYAGAETAVYIQRCQSPPHIAFPRVIVVGIINRLFRQAIVGDHVVQIVKDNDVLAIAGGIRVLATPGHTPDHMSYFWEREKVLFNGDLLDNEKQLEISRRSPWSQTDLQKSTRRVLDLNPAAICPGHGVVWQAAQDAHSMTALRESLGSVQG